jgi:hypothetical protein
VAEILINYRKADTGGQAALVHDLLAQHFGDRHVALDRSDTDVEARMNGVEVLLVLIGSTWLASEDGASGSPLENEDDPVGSILRRALGGTAKILPVLAPYVDMPDAAALPSAFASLTKRPSFPLDEDDMKGSVQQIIESIEKTLSSRGVELTVSETGLSDQDWQTLIANIQRGRVVPFLGRGLSPEVQAVRAELARSWADEMGYPKPADLVELGASDDDDAEERLRERWAREFAAVVQFVRVKQADPTMPYYWLSERLEKLQTPEFSDANAPYRILAELPFPAYLTTNQDRFLEAALQHPTIQKNPLSEHYVWSETMRPVPDSPLADSTYRPEPGKPVVYHLFGYSGADYEDSLVLSEDDYLSFIVGVTNEQTTLPQPILSTLTQNSLLFLGFEWNDLGFRSLLHSILPRVQHGIGKRAPNVAVQLEPGADAGMIDYVRGYFKEMNFSVYLGSPEQFTTELKEHWDRAKS